jgi:hypothetical protein
MTTHALIRPPIAEERRRSAEQAIAAAAPPPDPNVWHTWLCHRCQHPFKYQGIARHCTRCIHAAATAGVIGSEWIGEVSGA